jgi:hypothetical protein
MVNSDTSEHQWNDLLENLSELVTVREIKFGPCPVSVIQGVVTKMCKVDKLSAEFIMSSSGNQPAK